MLKAVTRCASAVDAKIASMNSIPPPSSRSASPVYSRSVSSASIASQSSVGMSVSDKSRSLVKAERDLNRPDKITPAYFFDHYATPEDITVMVTEEDFMAAQRELIPSVSAKELEHYARVRAQFESVGEREAREAASEEGKGRIVKEEQVISGAQSFVSATGSGSVSSSVNGEKGKLRLVERLKEKVNGTVSGKEKSDRKGKGKEKASEGYIGSMNSTSRVNGFDMGSAADDEDLY